MKLKVFPIIYLLCMSPKVFAEKTDIQKVQKSYIEQAYFHYSWIVDLVIDMDKKVQEFAKEVNKKNFLSLKESYIKARLPYGPSEVYRFYNGPIDAPDIGVETFINAWPLDERYIVEIINDKKKHPQITSELLVNLNEVGGEKNIATGFHAIEFLLWGVDQFRQSAGKNDHTYFLDSKLGSRRIQYLKSVSSLLIKHTTYVRDQWNKKNQKSFASKWLKKDKKQVLSDMLTGMSVLAYEELAGQRMFAAVDEANQEHEQSCFSDLTHIDLLGNLYGVRNIWDGQIKSPGYKAPHKKDFKVERPKLKNLQ